MPQPVSIVPRGGINRYPDVSVGDPSVAFDLNNARVFRGRVRALREGLQVGPNQGALPWFQVGNVGGEPLTVSNGAFGIGAGDFHNGHFYSTACDPAGCNHDLLVFPPEYGQAGVAVEGINDVPHIQLITLRDQIPSVKAEGLEFTNEANERFIETGVTQGRFVTYVFIPINSREEAGPWRFFDYQFNYAVPPSDTKGFEPVFDLTTLGDVARVEVYRTPEYDAVTGRFDTGASDACAARPFFWVASITESTYDNVTRSAYQNVAPVATTTKWDRFAAQALDYAPVIRVLTVLTGHPPGGPFKTLRFTSAAGSGVFTNASEWSIVDSGMAKADDGNVYYYVDIQVDPDTFPEYIDYQEELASDAFNRPIELIAREPLANAETTQNYGRGWIYRDEKVIRFNERRPGGDPDDPEDDEIIVVNQGGETLVRPRPVLKQEFPSTAMKGFCAGAIYNDGGTMLYGAPTWATTAPAIAYRSFDSNKPSIRLFYEYEANGRTFYGPPAYFTNDGSATGVPVGIGSVVVERMGGEIAVIVAVQDGANWRLAQRVPLDGTGQFYGSQDGCFTYRAPEFGTSFATLPLVDFAGQYAPTECIYEPNKVFLSSPNRPLEVTFRQAALPRGETVRYIGPARLDEDEAVASYSMYIATDRAIYYASRKGESLFYDQITAKVGVALGADGQPLWATGHYGGYFVGTDGHTYSATGREIRPLDDQIVESPGYGGFFKDLWNTIYDIEYHIRFRECWLATDEGVFCIDMGELNPANRRGVVAHYDLTDLMASGQVIKRLFYNPYDQVGIPAGYTSKGNMLAVSDQAGDGMMSLGDAGDYLGAPTFTTGYLADGVTNVSVDRVEVDYDPYPLNGVIPANPVTAIRQLGSITFFPRVRYPALAVTPLNTTVPGVQTITEVETHLPRYPKASGVGIQIQFSGFEELRSIAVMLQGLPKNA